VSAGRRGVDAAALVVAALLAGLAVLIWRQTAAMPATATYARIGPEAFPYAIAGGLAVLSALTAISAFRGGFPPREDDQPGPMLWIVGGLIAQMALLNTAGFSVAAGALFALAAAGFGRRRLWLTFPIGVAFGFAVWTIFSQLLNLSLPAGPLERLFF
jgi:putative tricarboxylic transport membrane protein